MFPIAHAYLMEQLIAAPTAMHYLGCVWPDMLFGGPLTHPQTHRQGRELLAFARQHDPAVVPFVQAALTHGSEPHGFDWYSDESYDVGAEKGYAFERARPFVPAIVAATGIDPEIGLWRAHNFIEMTFEIDLGRRFPHLGPAIRAACLDAPLVTQVTTFLAQFYGIDSAPLYTNIHNFQAAVALKSPDSQALAEKYSLQLQFKHNITNADVPAIAKILDQAWESIASDRDQFLATCVSQVASVLTL